MEAQGVLLYSLNLLVQLLSLWTLMATTFSCIVARSIYRLYFHPLSKFPGPRLAAITHLYEFYYDGIKGGKFIWEIARMHEEYGPIIRINPREIHIKDPYFYNQIYSSGVTEKDKYMVNITTVPLSTFSTVKYSHHRYRRGLLSPFFSRQSVLKLENIIQTKVDKVTRRLEKAHLEKSVVLLDEIFAALTADIISDYAYGRSTNILDEENLQNSFRDALTSVSSLCHFVRFFPILVSLLDILPSVIQWLNPITTGLFEMKRNVERLSIDALQGEHTTSTGSSARTIFQALSEKSVLPEERTVPRLRDEGMLLLGAGSETTARVVTIGAFYLYQNDYILQTLREELKQVMPTPNHKVSWTRLEKLPYFTAVVNESLRLAHSTTIRLPRVAPNRTLQYKNYTIPRGTPVSQSIYLVHTDPSVFPNPHKFDPERWIQPSQSAERLDRFLVPFSMGSRMCIGMSLSHCEIYLMLAALVRHFDLKHETTEEDIRITRDLIIGFPDTETLQVRSYLTDILSN